MSTMDLPKLPKAPTPKNPRGWSATQALVSIVRSRVLLLVVLTAIMSVYMTITYPSNFSTFSNLSAVLLNAAQDGILVVGMTLLMVGGQFDLSIGAIGAVSGIVSGLLVTGAHMNPVLALILGILAGGLCGAVNGWVITDLGINALIATLATQGVFYGIGDLMSAGTGVYPISNGFAAIGQASILGVQSPFWVMLVIVVVGSVAMVKTRFFRQFYFIGGNDRAAKLSGIRVKHATFIGFAIMGLLAGIAGTLTASRLNAADTSSGVGIELSIITAAVLGGASLKGGEGTVIGGVLGVVFIALLQNALIILGVGVFWQQIVVGVVLIVALSFGRISVRRI